MNRISFCENWCCRAESEPDGWQSVRLPHDAMQWDQRQAGAPSGVNLGHIMARDYIYEKRFTPPKDWASLCPVLEFEGVYRNAEVFLNGEKIASHDYGYTGFLVPLREHLRYGEENVLSVSAQNSDQPNSRWYSGTGIYRPVWLWLLPEEHILLQSVRITTLSIDPPTLCIKAQTTTPGTVSWEILPKGIKGRERGEQAPIAQGAGESGGEFSARLTLPEARLWSPEEPYLYTCRLTFEADVREVTFGIRTLTCEEEKGFALNGRRVILRGACMHHDNGLLGARCEPFAEARKVRILKENGYNAIRSAHNPCSEAMLQACDELGMLMVDEYADMWYIRKTRYDYADKVEENYRRDIADIVAKDYNHPSVILYSTGNEVSETAQSRGIALTEALTKRFHELDSTRGVTCGVNLFFNFLSSMGFGVYSDQKAQAQTGEKKAVGSEFFNQLAGLMGAGFMKWGATLPFCDWKTRDAFERMDVAGYNYGIRRYEADLKRYPHRLILGSETFCSDACRFWELAKREPRLIGDFVWSGMDYLGEVGIGAMEYPQYAPYPNSHPGWVSAGAGRIDLTGKPLAEMAYTRVAFELQDMAIAVLPVKYAKERTSPSAWKMTPAVESWSWNGCEGMPATVEVYARAHHITLFVNDKPVGTKRPRGDCRVTFRTTYQDGTVRAVAYDEANRELYHRELSTAGEETRLTLLPERQSVGKGELCYVNLCYADEKGTVKPLERGEITLRVEGGELVAAGSGCPVQERSFLDHVTDTYYGQALAILRAGAGETLTLYAQSELGSGRVSIPIK